MKHSYFLATCFAYMIQKIIRTLKWDLYLFLFNIVQQPRKDTDFRSRLQLSSQHRRNFKKKWLTARDTLAIKYQVKNKFPRFSSILAFFRVCWESVGPSLPTYFIQLMGKNMRYISRMERDIRALVSHFHHIFKRAHMLDLKNVMFHSYL